MNFCLSNRWLTPFFCFVLVLIAHVVPPSHAAGEFFDINLNELKPAPYELDLKELRKAPRRRSAQRNRSDGRKPSRSVSHASGEVAGEETSYVVRAGDFPYLILTRHFGLSPAEAENVIPRLMRLNNLQDSRRLTIGQRLIMPPLPGRRSGDDQPERKTPAASGAEPMREVRIYDSSPCRVANDMAGQLGMRVPPLIPFLRAENASLAYEDRKLAVVCGATPAEIYTFERLLAGHDVLPLFFDGSESSRVVVESLADALEISYWVVSDSGDGALPVSYVFSEADASGHDVRLTVLPVPAVAEKSALRN